MILIIIINMESCDEFMNYEITHNTKVGLVLSGGGTRGFAHLGVLEVLEKKNIPFSVIVGTSVGSLIGVCIAAGKSIKETLDHFLADRLLFSALTFSRVGVLDSRRIVKKILLFAGVTRFSQLTIPFICNAMDINSGEEKVFSKGNLEDALCASISFPGLISPVKVGSKYYVDGGNFDNAAVHLLPPVDLALIVDVGAPLSSITEKSSALDVFSNALSFWIKRRFEALDSQIMIDLPHILCQPDVAAYPVFDYRVSKFKELVTLGRKKAELDFKKVLVIK